MTPERFHEIRKSKGYTQQQMADALNVTRLTVYNWEKGKYQIPQETEAQTIALAEASKQEDAGALLTTKNHPECFLPDGKHIWRTLAHPRWYSSGDCPLRHKVPDDQKLVAATVGDLAVHVAPSMEQVVELFLQNWPTAQQIARHRSNGWMYESSCKEYLKRRGRADLCALIPHDATHDAERPPAPPTRTWSPDEIPSIGELDSFTFPKET